MMEIEIENKTVESDPDVSVLDKAFDILRKAGFPQEALDKSYEILKEACGEPVEEEGGNMEMEMPMKKKGEYEEPSMPGDMKGMMMQAMKSLIDRKSR